MMANHVTRQLTYINGADRLHPYVSHEAVNMMRSKLATTKRTLNNHIRSSGNNYHHVQSSDNLHRSSVGMPGISGGGGGGVGSGSNRKHRLNQHSHIA